jgi:hypothetical protein
MEPLDGGFGGARRRVDDEPSVPTGPAFPGDTDSYGQFGGLFGVCLYVRMGAGARRILF